MRRNHADLLVVSGLAILAALVSAISGDNSNVLRAALGLSLVLFLPGYALSAALLPDGRAGLAERIAFSLGLSIAIAVLGGLLLHFLPSGLTARSWRFLLLGATLSAAGYALLRREQGRIAGPGPLVTQIPMREAVLLSSAALLIGLALGLGATGVDPVSRTARADTSFTQLWALPEQTGQRTIIRVGLQNYEDERVTYRVTLEAGDRLLAEWPQVTVVDGQSWQAQATVPANLSAQEIVAHAYRDGTAEPYRAVRLIIPKGGRQ